ADLIAGCVANGSPNTSIGRPLKVGKEELFGILAAVEWSLGRDEEALIAWYEEVVAGRVAGLQGLPGVTVERGFPSEAGQPFGGDLPVRLWVADPQLCPGSGLAGCCCALGRVRPCSAMAWWRRHRLLGPLLQLVNLDRTRLGGNRKHWTLRNSGSSWIRSGVPC